MKAAEGKQCEQLFSLNFKALGYLLFSLISTQLRGDSYRCKVSSTCRRSHLEQGATKNCHLPLSRVHALHHHFSVRGVLLCSRRGDDGQGDLERPSGKPARLREGIMARYTSPEDTFLGEAFMSEKKAYALRTLLDMVIWHFLVY